MNGDFARIGGARATVTLKLSKHKPTGARHVPWNDLQCRVVSPDVKTGPCTKGRKKLVFFKGAHNLREYVLRLESGRVSRAQHGTLFAAVHKVIGSSFFNHNLDVDVLHFKG